MRKVIKGCVRFGSVIAYFYFNKHEVSTFWTNNYISSTKWDDNWDRRDPKFLHNPKKRSYSLNNQTEDITHMLPTAKRHLFLIRHGQYKSDKELDSDRILTTLGVKQAALTGERLSKLGYKFSSLISSSSTRARMTAEKISCYFQGMLVDYNDLLCEGNPIPPEPKTGHWKPSVIFFEDGPRIEAAFRKYFYRADKLQKQDSFHIIVCHANVIRYFVCRALQLPPEAWIRFSHAHAGITRITIEPNGRVSLIAFNDCGHLPPEMITYT